jgi:RimJ/RimL family protein N-acetyltransferase
LKICLETPRLVLREFEEADLDLLVELDSDPEVMGYINGGAPSDREIIRREVLPRWLAFYERPGSFGYWAAIERGTGRFVGWFHFRPCNCPGEIELGYRLKRSAWGRGYATEGSRALISKGFAELGLRRVVAVAMAGNAASIRVMERAGLQFDGNFVADQFPGADKRAVKYALDRPDFEKVYGRDSTGAPG